MMRILILNSVYGFASTGRICADIAKEAQQNGNECMVGCREARAVEKDNTHVVQLGSVFNTRIHGALSRWFDNEGLNSKMATKRFLRQASEFDPDLLWIHNIHGHYINYEMLFSWIKSRPDMEVKWLLHDCWAFTGHCAYFSMVGCNKWKDECCHCPQTQKYPKSVFVDNSLKNYKRKRAAFSGVHNMTILTPSRWLADLAEESFLSEYPIEVRYNRIDTNVFKPTMSDFKKRNHIEEKRVVLGAANIWTYRKGLDRFIEIANMLPENYVVVLVGEMSEKQKKRLPKNILAYGKTKNTTELAEIYSAADVFLCLTREDNYPTVNLEAEACGTRVITLDVGGCKETIHRKDSIAVASIEDVCSEIKRGM